MIIKKPENPYSKKAYKLKSYINFLAYTSLFLSIIMIAIAIPLVQKNWGFLKPKVEIFDARFGISNIMYLPEIVGYKIKSIFTSSELIEINIKHIDLQKIEYMRQNAQKGLKKFDYVPAKITFGKETYKVKIRLKGDRKVHYEDLEHASFRIKMKGDETFMGMKVFSIHKPRVRNYIEEWIFLKMMEDEDMIAPRYKFVQVSMNGKNNGLFAIEEHYTKHLIENRKRKEGPIIRFKEDITLDFKSAIIEPYESKKWTQNESLPLTEKAIYLLDSFRNGNLTIDQVFDVKKFAKFFAIADLNLARHAVVSKSLRLHYNPITSKLEPIPFDAHRGTALNYQHISAELGITKNKNWTYNSYREWFKYLFNTEKSYSQKFYSEYIRTLQRISKKSYLDNFFMLHKDEIDRSLLLIYGDNSLHDNVFSFGPFPYYFDKKSYYNTQRSIEKLLKTPRIEVYLESVDEKNIAVSILNQHRALPYEILSLTYKKFTMNLNDKNNLLLVKELEGKKRSSKKFLFNIPSQMKDVNIEKNALQLHYKFPGLDKVYTTSVFPWKKSGLDQINNDTLRLKPNLDTFSFVKVNEKNKVILIENGTHKITHNMIIPSGYKFKVNAGVVLNLSENIFILSYSPIEWLGNKDNPIILDSDNRTKKGQGLLVLNADKISNLSHVHFRNLSHPSKNNWSTSGSVSFYESDINAKKIVIENNYAEDGLNIIRSKFNIEESSFINIKSDALDVDFGKGEISKSSFINIGNDAIDVSGTNLKLAQIKILNVGDKAISAGEESRVIANRIEISKAEIGITSKDNSKVDAMNVMLKDSKLGLTAFQKKSEYGPGTISIRNYELFSLKLDHAIEVDSSLVLDGTVIYGNVKNVKKLLYGNEYGKKTK